MRQQIQRAPGILSEMSPEQAMSFWDMGKWAPERKPIEVISNEHETGIAGGDVSTPPLSTEIVRGGRGEPGEVQRFIDGITRTAEEHPFGAAVEVKDPAFYEDSTSRLFLSPDGLAGAAVTGDKDPVSVFRHPESSVPIDRILKEVAPAARTLDGFDINGVLPNLYGRYGFRPAARVKFNREYAPPTTSARSCPRSCDSHRPAGARRSTPLASG